MNLTEPAGFPLVLGTWQLDGRDWGPISARDGKTLLLTAWERGFRHFDTAERYGNGRAEQLIGQALRGVIRDNREAISIASKSELRTPVSLTRHLERSLRRIGTDYLDLYYIHWPRKGLSLPAAVEELERDRRRGLIRAIGLSNVTLRELEEAQGAATIDAVQLGYNLIWRRPEREFGALLAGGAPEPPPTAAASPAPPRVYAYSPLAQGLLAHPFPAERDRLPEDHRRTTPLFMEPAWPAVHAFAEEMRGMCRERGLEPAAVALAWLLARGVTPVVGVRTPTQLDRLVEAIRRLGSPPWAVVEAPGAAEREILAALTIASDALQSCLPDLPNMFGYVPRPCDPPESAVHT